MINMNRMIQIIFGEKEQGNPLCMFGIDGKIISVFGRNPGFPQLYRRTFDFIPVVHGIRSGLNLTGFLQ